MIGKISLLVLLACLFSVAMCEDSKPKNDLKSDDVWGLGYYGYPGGYYGRGLGLGGYGGYGGYGYGGYGGGLGYGRGYGIY